MALELDRLVGEVRRQGVVVRIVVTHAEGSVPRNAGTAMLVGRDVTQGTIGGGALEHQAIVAARGLLEAEGAWARQALALALGPALGQCCGGAVRLLLERFSLHEVEALEALRGAVPAFVRPPEGARPPAHALESPAVPEATVAAARRSAGVAGAIGVEGWLVEAWEPSAAPVWIWGAGHVGRALVGALEGLPLRLTWLDDAPERFPERLPQGVEPVVVASPAAAAEAAPAGATHYVLTYSHALDLELCHRILSRPFAHLGLIGSATKRARFERRLVELGHAPAVVARVECPIGDPALGKEPQAIALGVAASLLRRLRAG